MQIDVQVQMTCFSSKPKSTHKYLHILDRSQFLFVKLIFILARVSKEFDKKALIESVIHCMFVCPTVYDLFTATWLRIIGMNHSNEKCALFATNKNTQMAKKKPVDSPRREKAFLLNFRQNEPAYIKTCISCDRGHNWF